jgi:hypothetical protein
MPLKLFPISTLIDRLGTLVSYPNYPLVHEDDQWAVKIVNPTEDGPWIAGGSCLKWYNNQPLGLSDIDVFCKNTSQSDALIQKITSIERQLTKFTSSNATTFELWQENRISKTWAIQIITMDYFDSMQNIIDRFDISVCKIATDGSTYLLGDTTAADIRSQTLRMAFPLRDDAVKRYIKYQAYGYTPTAELSTAISNSPNLNWNFTKDDDYENSF